MISLLERVVGAPVLLEELKHKPGRRRTQRAIGPRGSAIVKVYESERVTMVAARIQALGEGPADPRVPEVLLVDPGLHLLVLSDLPGYPLRIALLSGDEEACARASRALGIWHRFWSGSRPPPLLPHTAARELEILRSKAEQAPPSIAALTSSALPTLSEDWPPTTVVHRDLYEEQILLGNEVGLIDLDDAALGPPELDVGNLLAHVELLALRAGRDLSAPAEALLAGYAATGPALDPARLDGCRSLSRLRLACIHRHEGLLGLEA